MSKLVWVLVLAAAALAFLTFWGGDPLGLMPASTEQTQDDDEGEGLEADGVGLATSGAARAEEAALLAAGAPLGVLDLGLGQGKLTGLVTDFDSAALPEAHVAAVIPGQPELKAVRTRTDGTYEIRGLPEGQFDVRGGKQGFRSRTEVAPPLAAGTEAAAPTIALKPRADIRTSLQILATDTFGRALPGAKVLATTMSWDMHIAAGPEAVGWPGVRSKRGVTDDEGRVTLAGLEPDAYNVVVDAQGYETTSRYRVMLTDGETKRMVLRLEEGVTLTGTLVDFEGKPVGGGMIMGFLQPMWTSSMPAQSNEDGTWTLEGLSKGQYMLVGYQADRGSAMAPAKAPGPSAQIKLPGAGRIIGKVIDSEGEPVTSGQVRSYQNRPFGYYYSQIEQLSSEGTFSLNLPQGDWNVRVEASDGRVSPDMKVDVPNGETREIEVKMPANMVIQGVVMDSAGDHVEGADVFVMIGGFPETPSREHWARTDAEGVFVVSGLPPEKTSLHVEHPHYSSTTFEATPAPSTGAPQTKVTLPRGGVILGTVVDAEGAPVASEQVNAMPEGGYMDVRVGYTDASGRFVFDGLDVKKWTVSTGAMGAPASTKEDVQVTDGGQHTVRLSLPTGGGTVTGIVRVGGVPAAGADVVAGDARSMTSARATTDAQGAFVLEGLTVGSVRVSATALSGGTGRTTVTISKETMTATAEVDIGTATFRARVIDADGAPLSGCWSNLESPEANQGGESRWSQLPQTGADGVVEKVGVQPGTWRFRATETRHAHYISAPFTITDGKSLDLGTVQLKLAAEVTGRISDDTGAPVEKATLSVRRPDGSPVMLFSMSTSGSDGRYVLRGIEPGTYMVRAEAKGYAPADAPLSLTQEGGVANITMPRPGSIGFEVVNDAGDPIAAARILLYDAQGNLVTKTLSIVNWTDTGRARTGEDGTTSITDLAAGPYQVRAEADGYEMTGPAAAMSVRPGARSGARIILSAVASDD